MKRRLLAVLMALCVVMSGCGVRSGMERVDDAKQAKKQVEKQRDKMQKLEKRLNGEQEN
jgi:cell division protein FtsB